MELLPGNIEPPGNVEPNVPDGEVGCVLACGVAAEIDRDMVLAVGEATLRDTLEADRPREALLDMLDEERA